MSDAAYYISLPQFSGCMLFAHLETLVPQFLTTVFPSRTPTLILRDLARFLQMTLILQDLARFLQMTLILQDARSGRLSCKKLARSCKIDVENVQKK